MFGAAFQATAFQNNAFQIGTDVAPVPPLAGGGGASKAHARRLRESFVRRVRFEEERKRRIDALDVEVERPPLIPAPETVAMLNRVLDEPITREHLEDDGGEEELLLLLLAD